METFFRTLCARSGKVGAKLKDTYDVVVAGAGCAGSVFAGRMASRGFRVLLLERERAEAIGRDRRDLIENDAFELSCVERPTAPEARPGFRGLEVLTHDSTTSVALSDFPYTVVDRRLLASRLLAKATGSGAELVTQCIVGSAEVEKGTVTSVATDHGTFRCRLAVDASGSERVLCRTFPRGMGIPRQLSSRDYLSIYRETRASDGRDEREGQDESPGPSSGYGRAKKGYIRFYVGRNGGYSWVQAEDNGESRVEFGAAVQDGPSAPDPRDIVRGWVDAHGASGDALIGACGGRIPARRPLSTMVAPGLMVVGDSACQALPVICRGVGSAMIAATMAADAAAFALEARDVGLDGLWSYNYNYMRERGAYAAALDCMRIFLQCLPEKDLQWCLASGIIDEWDIAVALVGRSRMPTTQARLRSVIKGLGDAPLMMRLEGALKHSQKVFEHYLLYPKRYDPSTYAEWAHEADFLVEDAWRLAEKVLLPAV